MILKARALKGALSSAGRSVSSSVFGLVPFTGGMSSGEGMKSTMASSSFCTPLFL